MYFVFKDFMFILVLKYLTQNLPVNDNIQYILIMLPPFGQKLYFAMKGCAMILNTWKLCPSLQAVNSNVPAGSNNMYDTGSLAWAWKCATKLSSSLSSVTQYY
jgi:hypothetical protein